MNPTAMIVALLGVCGTAALADRTPQTLGADRLGDGRPAGHIYVNLVTGERILTHDRPTPVARGAGGSEPAWMADNAVPCAAYGLNTRLVSAVDQPGLDPSDPFYAVSVGATYLDWGDIAFDTVVDAVGLAYATKHADQDLDANGFPDGVEGFGATWMWFDRDNGHNDGCSGQWLVTSFTLHGLPGSDLPDGNQFALYFLTVDLVSGFDQSETFELGDTDSDPQGAAHHRPGGGQDRDGDGLHDFSHAVRFHQPGTRDFDGDGLPDGDPNAAADAAILLIAPSGPAVPHPTIPGRYIIDPVDPAPAAQGLEEGFDIYTDHAFFGTYWYAGFSCDRDANGIPGDQPNDYRPFASFYQQLYSPGTSVPCPADLFPPPAGDGVLNFFDLSRFITLFNAQDPQADFFPPGGDGVLNFFDVVAYINALNAGCP